MLDIIVTLIIVAALGFGLRAQAGGSAIVRRPYNNRLRIATGAREDHPSARVRRRRAGAGALLERVLPGGSVAALERIDAAEAGVAVAVRAPATAS